MHSNWGYTRMSQMGIHTAVWADKMLFNCGTRHPCRNNSRFCIEITHFNFSLHACLSACLPACQPRRLNRVVSALGTTRSPRLADRPNQLNVSHFVIQCQLLLSHGPCRLSNSVPSERLQLVKRFIPHRLHTGA